MTGAFWRCLLAVAGLFGLAAATLAFAHASPRFDLPGSGPAGLSGTIESMQAVPGGSFSAVKLSGRQELYLLSGNGRFVLRGPVFDLWQGRELGSVEEIREAASTLNLAGLGVVWSDLEPTILGEGQDEVVVFVDPLCPHCRTLVDQARALVEAEPRRWRFVLLAIPMLGNRSGEVVRNLHCAEDQSAARRALIEHRFGPPLPERANCDLGPAQRRWVLARLLGLEGVPFTVRPDGRTMSGAGADFAAWLRASGPRLAGAPAQPAAGAVVRR
jgi:thiol:disulfide interchange protein DsbC